ncbi:MAG: glutaminase domain-containing protein [Terriglobia bacterium]
MQNYDLNVFLTCDLGQYHRRARTEQVSRSALAVLAALIWLAAAPARAAEAFQPRAVPLVTTDPYFSIWSFSDHLTDDATRHWTGTPQSLESMIRIDGAVYRIMGRPVDEEALPQVGLAVFPTRTVYDFEGAGVHVTLTFLTPLLPGDLDVYSRPVTYVSWEVRSVDGRAHAVSVYYANSAQLVVNTEDQAVEWSREKIGGLSVMRMGSKAQPVLAKSGDDLRIDWGYLYDAAPQSEVTASAIARADPLHEVFVAHGVLPGKDDATMPRAANRAPLMAFAFDMGQVGAEPVARHLILAYDDLYSIEYFHQRLRPYWRRNGAQAADLLTTAEREYDSLRAESEKFDRDLMADLTRVGGEKYARIAALAYRQGLAAHKLVAAPDGQTPYYFPKENFSCGCIATVDVIYPAAPVLLLLNPHLVEASLAPVMDYVKAGKWPFPYAPHDLGTYPVANGRDPTKIETMPVEESGNMLILFAAIAKAEGNTAFAEKYAPILKQWADYLVENGFNPENQLCTDDFAGHLAHNTNLSIKAILGLGSYAQILEVQGKKELAGPYRDKAQEFAKRWVEMASDGDHYRLAFDKPGTWSQKYNLVWDKILGLNLFPPEVAQKEIAFYLNHLNRYGWPLDNRKTYTKLDWEVWSATLADSPADWERLISPIYDWISASPTRVPMTDWYWTRDGTQVGFQARSVVGGIFIKMLSDPATWKAWTGRVSH